MLQRTNKKITCATSRDKEGFEGPAYAARSLQPRALICSCLRAHGGADLEAVTATGSACGEAESSPEETRPILQAADAMFVCFRDPAGSAGRAVRSELEQIAQAMQLRPLT